MNKDLFMSQRFPRPNFNENRQLYQSVNLHHPTLNNGGRQATSTVVDSGNIVEIPDLYINNYMDGHGFYKYSDGTEYNGDYKDFQRHGKGLYIYTSGTLYEGEFKFGKKDGWGIYKYADGTIYEGYVLYISIKSILNNTFCKQLFCFYFVLFLPVNFEMIKNMVEGCTDTLLAPCTMANGEKTKRMVEACIDTQTAIYMKVSSRITSVMVAESIVIPMALSTTENS